MCENYIFADSRFVIRGGEEIRLRVVSQKKKKINTDKGGNLERHFLRKRSRRRRERSDGSS